MNKLNCISVDEQNTVFRERKQKQKPKPCDGRKEGQLVTVLRGGVDELLWRGRLEMCDFWQQEEGFFSSCRVVIIEWAQCPGNRQGGTGTVRAVIRAI